MKSNGKIIDARSTSDSVLAAIKSDIIIIGSGAAACAMATRLLDRGLQVTMLEAGDFLVDSDSSRFYAMNRQEPFGLSLQIGGATNLWSGRVAPLESRDITTSRGWPFELSEIEPYYGQAAELLKVRPTHSLAEIAPYEGSSPKWKEFLQDRSVSIKRFQWNRPTFNGLVHLKALASRYSNLTLIYNCRALKLLSDELGRRVHFVLAAIGTDKTVQFSAEFFALCAGGLENPRIMLNSRSTGGFLANDNIGRYFSGHPKANVGRIHLFRPVRARSPLFCDIETSDGAFRFGIGLTANETENAIPLNHYVQLSPKFESIGFRLLEHAQHIVGGTTRYSRENSPAKNVVRHVVTAASALGQLLFNLIGKVGLLGKGGSVLVVRGFFDQEPNAENRIELTEELDPYGMRKGRVKWSITREDQQTIEDFLSELSSLLSKHEIGVLKSDLPPVGHPWSLTEIHSHFMGTTRMGLNPHDSVTDGDGRVHGVENLYVGGSSLFTTYGYANPVLTIMALALLTADKICERLHTKTGAIH
ncbi:GMC oxidoreductase [Ensifer sp. LCM 4579]|uniref:GMC oxidoreductase n=1 Tax=Ensifer sp. LCM 4579 TaxID=1848292 RepID=UPI0008D97ED4|nr:GMC family oxidoreductase [Ensifer sp. LCM 4579]OHV77962.1 hypothetical protein LCM4579_06320 [Ensifer sp. LCM 4579]